MASIPWCRNIFLIGIPLNNPKCNGQDFSLQRRSSLTCASFGVLLVLGFLFPLGFYDDLSVCSKYLKSGSLQCPGLIHYWPMGQDSSSTTYRRPVMPIFAPSWWLLVMTIKLSLSVNTSIKTPLFKQIKPIEPPTYHRRTQEDVGAAAGIWKILRTWEPSFVLWSLPNRNKTQNPKQKTEKEKKKKIKSNQMRKMITLPFLGQKSLLDATYWICVDYTLIARRFQPFALNFKKIQQYAPISKLYREIGRAHV